MADVWFLAEDGEAYEMGGVGHEARLVHTGRIVPDRDRSMRLADGTWDVACSAWFLPQAEVAIGGPAVCPGLMARALAWREGAGPIVRGRLVVGEGEAVVGDYPGATIVDAYADPGRGPTLRFLADYPFAATFDSRDGDRVTVRGPQYDFPAGDVRFNCAARPTPSSD